MCAGKCACCVAGTLYPLVLLSIICNTLLFFPGWDIKYVKDGHITEEVKYMGGLVGGGLLVLISALFIHMVAEKGCCENRFGMFLSVVFATVGVVGALYSFAVAAVGLNNGPLCKSLGLWATPFKNSTPTYLFHRQTWSECTEPSKVVEFNIVLFATLMAASFLQFILCAIQIINGLLGCICGTGDNQMKE